MKAILINPFDKTITEVDYDGDFMHIYDLIDAGCFGCARISEGDGIFIDDDGLLKNPTHFFLHSEYHSPLAGKGLILGCDDQGEAVSCKTTVEEVRAKVSFRNIFQVREEYAA
jgi:hypothetical protein